MIITFIDLRLRAPLLLRSTLLLYDDIHRASFHRRFSARVLNYISLILRSCFMRLILAASMIHRNLLDHAGFAVT